VNQETLGWHEFHQVDPMLNASMPSQIAIRFVVFGLILAATVVRATEPADLAALLEPLRAEHKLPALAAAVLEGDQLVGLGAVGKRKAGDDTPVATGDVFHIGSNTKSMTATLAALLVAEGKISWNQTVGQAFPEFADSMDPGWRDVTLYWLVRNRGGAPADLMRDGLWLRLWADKGTPQQVRAVLAQAVLKQPPEGQPGEKFIYSNAGFTLAGMMLERASGMAWEELIRARLFEPLGMKSAGLGAPGRAGAVEQPWGHTPDGKPVEPGRLADNPPVIGPAGVVHTSLADWAKYAALHLAAARGRDYSPPGGKPLAKAADLAPLHVPPPDVEPRYAAGWLAFDRPEWGGRALFHNGSNTMWFAVQCLVPEKNVAYLVATNQGGPPGEAACMEALPILAKWFADRAARK
jgi:CubicO group peptidase (beta-lactamase class C family)